MDQLVELLLSDAALNGLGIVLGAAAAYLVKRFGWDAPKRKRLLDAVNVAYDFVELLKSRTPTKIDDKAAIALKAIKDQLGRELSASEVALVRAELTARHDAEKHLEVAKALAERAIANAKQKE